MSNLLLLLSSAAVGASEPGQSKRPHVENDPFQQLYQSAVLDDPHQCRIPDDDVAEALNTLAEAQRRGLLPANMIEAYSLIIGGSWVDHEFQRNRIGKMRESESPVYPKVYKAAIDLAACFPSQFPEADQSQGPIYTLRLLAQSGLEEAEVRAAALNALRRIGTAQAFQELARAFESLNLETPGTGYALRRRKILTTLAEMNPTAAAPYVWRELPRLPDTEAAIAWKFILSRSDSILPLLRSMPENLSTNEARQALAAALAAGQKAKPLVDKLRPSVPEPK